MMQNKFLLFAQMMRIDEDISLKSFNCPALFLRKQLHYCLLPTLSWRASGLYWLSGKITVTLLSVWPISFPQIPFRATAAAGMVMPCRPQPFLLHVPTYLTFDVFRCYVSFCRPGVSCGSRIPDVTLPHGLSVSSDSALFCQMGPQRDTKDPLSPPSDEIWNNSSTFHWRFEFMCKYAAFGSSRQSLRSVRCKLNVKEPPGNVKFGLLQSRLKKKWRNSVQQSSSAGDVREKST